MDGWLGSYTSEIKALAGLFYPLFHRRRLVWNAATEIIADWLLESMFLPTGVTRAVSFLVSMFGPRSTRLEYEAENCGSVGVGVAGYSYGWIGWARCLSVGSGVWKCDSANGNRSICGQLLARPIHVYYHKLASGHSTWPQYPRWMVSLK